jgi:Pvc16 N-terminal domain
MSYALAIATVSAVLKSLLDNRLAEQGVAATVGDVSVTALPPDRISVGTEERSQLNLFLYRITPNTALHRSPREGAEKGEKSEKAEKGAARDQAKGAGQGSPPALALDLHYILSAYGEQDLQAEILLGYAIQLFHQTPVLTPERIRSALVASNREGAALPPARAALGGAHLADHVERIGISPEYLSAEEASRIWSTLQARYRPSAAFKVSPVMIAADG